ncbi:hypothetical protein QYE76_031450 [Lolium multiflorum]|uniref:Retrotransposon gag domain-containing protein n=1 Tax=Lolium multiflorum TaxID=4521 RepID=A0AAD8QS67_LOLMU|nr:hypothetical protein QYE76_031450 [Lolium multiflorum]
MVQQQPQQPLDEDGSVNGDNADAAAQGIGRGRGLPRGVNRGFAEIGARRVPPQPQDDGLGKPKFSIPRFEGTTDVEEYLTWELKIERLWRLHDYTEDRKIKLASSEFDGYALRWWDGLVRAREEDGELPIITWRTMKAAMRARFVPTNYLRSVFDKLTQLKQGVMTVDAYYMEMEMLMQRARVRESLEMTLQRFLNGLKFNIKGIVRHHSYTTMNELLHHAREAESQLADEAQQRGRAMGAGRFTLRAPSPTAPAPSTRDTSQTREMNHIAYGTAPSLDGELLPLHGSSIDEDGGGDGSGVDGEAFGGTSPLGRVPERLLSPDLGFAMAAAAEGLYRGFLCKGFRCGGFI